jgi:choline dehydrogenase
VVDAADVVVIGAGSAGCLLANRLSADPGRRVVLLEAGGRDRNPLTRVPLLAGLVYYLPSLNWGYRTAPDPGLNGRSLPWPRGRVLGGSSTINGMMYMRGHRRDYDGWRQLGLDGWGYDDVLPYFKAFERNLSHPDDHFFHGRDGELVTAQARGANPLYQAWLAAAAACGLPASDDHNAAVQDGLGLYDFNIANGRRVSAATAFLRPVAGRANLTVLTGAQATRLRFDGRRCTGVDYRSGGAARHIAAGEVALCGGAINSPALLQHSGIGDAALLAAHGIAVVRHCPAVGGNLQDHLGVYLQHRCRQPVTLYRLFRPDVAVRVVAQALLFGSGPAAAVPLEAGGFLRTRPELDIPDIHVTFVPGLSLAASRAGQREHGFLTNFYLLRPQSRGRIAICSADPLAHPRIDPGYLAAAADLRAMRDGVRLVRRIAAAAPLDAFRGAELAPGAAAQSDAAIDDWIRATAGTIFHPAGTCRMGADDDAVVDASLRVRGVAGLRVVDASVMPTLIGGNTSVPTMMIAEKAADLMRGRPPRARADAAATRPGAIHQGSVR